MISEQQRLIMFAQDACAQQTKQVFSQRKSLLFQQMQVQKQLLTKSLELFGNFSFPNRSIILIYEMMKTDLQRPVFLCYNL